MPTILRHSGVFVTFDRGATDDFGFAIRTPQLDPTPLVAAFRDILLQLGVDEAPADALEQQVAAAPSDQTERIEVGLGADRSVVLGQWTVGPGASIAPIAGSGRVVLSGTWQPWLYT